MTDSRGQQPPFSIVKVNDTVRDTWIVVDARRHKVSPEFRSEADAEEWLENNG